MSKKWTKGGMRIKGNPGKGRPSIARSLIKKKKSESLTSEQQTTRDRIQRQGFHDGAHVPGSNVRKVDK
jgi:hypothetical protein